LIFIAAFIKGYYMGLQIRKQNEKDMEQLNNDLESLNKELKTFGTPSAHLQH